MTARAISASYPPARVREWTVYGAIAGFAVLAAIGVAVRPLLPVDETRYLSVAWEMWQSGDLLVPTQNGELYSHKPPLLFWLINAVWAVTGVSEFAARLIAPAFGTLAVLLTYRLEQRFWPGRFPLAALVLATTGVFLIFAALTMFDAMLTVAVLTGISALWRASREDGVLPWVWFGAALALGVLSKGPVILVHLLPAGLAMPLWAPAGTPRGRWYAGLGLSVLFALALVALWLVPALIAGGEAYQEAVLWKQSAGRVVTSFAHRKPFWFFIALLPVLLWPWGWSVSFWRGLFAQGSLRDPAIRLCLIWAGSAFIIFSLISGKQIHYLLPELPAFALVFSRHAPESIGRRDWAPALLPVGLALAAAAVAATGMVPIRKLQAIDPSPSWAGLACAIALVAGAAALLSTRRTAALAAVAPVLVASIYLAAGSEIARVYGPGDLARALKPFEERGLAQVGGSYHGEFTFAGRLTRPVAVLETPGQIAQWAGGHPGGLIFGRADRVPEGTVCNRTELFRGRFYCLATLPDSP